MASLNISSHRPIQLPPQPQLQQQPQQQQQQPLTAPQPTRANAAPPPVTSGGGIWSPEMGIRFGGQLPAPGTTQPGRPGDHQNKPANPGAWDPSKGLRFS
jgi:programmed cell death 6-interacting protein